MRAIDLIAKYHPCQEATTWLGERGPEQGWTECSEPEWMLWIAARIGVTDPELRALARRFAMRVIDRWNAPQIVRDWLETGDESLRLAAWSAATAATAAWSAAESAAWAAWSAAESAAWSAAESAARAAWSAAESAAWSAARSAASAEKQAQCDEIRALLPWTRIASLVGVP